MKYKYTCIDCGGTNVLIDVTMDLNGDELSIHEWFSYHRGEVWCTDCDNVAEVIVTEEDLPE